jgi:LMBR1 domain-containing protein 1
MADWYLILATCISFVLLLLAATYFLVHYQHPDDKNDAWFPKLTVLLGLVLAGATVLLLPLDVANNEGYAGTLRAIKGCSLERSWCASFIQMLAVITVPQM